MKINVSINDDLLKKIDEYVASNYMTRSGFISFISNKYLVEVESQALLKDLSKAMRKIADTGKIDDEILEQLEAFEKVFGQSL